MVQYYGLSSQEEHRPRPIDISSKEILTWDQQCERFLREGPMREILRDPVHFHGVKLVLALFQLPY